MLKTTRGLLSKVRAEAPEQKVNLPWVFAALLLLTLPNLVAAFVPRTDPLGLLMCFHALGLMMLPCIFGLKVRRWLTWLLPLCLVIPIATVYLWITGTLPTTFCYLALMESDSEELGCFRTQGIAAGFAVLPLLLLTGFVVRRKIAREFKLGLIGRAVAVAAVLAMFPYAIAMGKAREAVHLASSYSLSVFPVGTAYSVSEALQFRNRLEERRASGERLAVAVENPAPGSGSQREVDLLVIGESARGANFQINGYERATTPRLSAMDGLVSFKDVAAAAPMTLAAVPQMLTPAAPGQFLDTLNLPSIPAAFRKAGYKVYWFSTQRKHGVYDTTTSAFSADADESKFIGGKFDAANMGNATSAQDWQLMGPLCEVLKRNEQKVLIILHTMGSHGPAYTRYPNVMSHFPVDVSHCISAMSKTTLTEAEHEAMLNAYDNSVFATDWLIGEIVKQLQAQNTSSWLYYAADHGENMGAPIPFAHGTMTLDVLQVPLFVWTSPQYQAAKPRQVAALRRNAGLPVSNRCTFHTVLDLAGIKCDGMKPNSSLASPSFTQEARLVSYRPDRAIDFDKEVKPHHEKELRQTASLLPPPGRQGSPPGKRNS
jgi:glucan phosphoethanolaminetransferase (alkaline phosphatase superfamily)